MKFKFKIQQYQTDGARKLFNSISTARVKYYQVANYQDLLDALGVL